MVLNRIHPQKESKSMEINSRDDSVLLSRFNLKVTVYCKISIDELSYVQVWSKVSIFYAQL